MLGSVDVRDAVGSDGRWAGDAVGRDAAAAGGDVDGYLLGTSEGGAISGVCEAGQVREEGTATGVEGQEGCVTAANMRLLHKGGTNDLQALGSTPITTAARGMDEGYALLFALAEDYVKNGGPPAQPPAWLQPPAQQNGDTAVSAARKKPARTSEGPEGRQGSLVGVGVSGGGRRVGLA